ncbi:MAG TPA: UPF0182 family protein, partial [Gemmatimonadaceae bacterium]|nr:UPF0182 family protein [Gemmatimonadaceae bacterium]
VVLWAVWHGLRPIALTIFIFMALAGPGASLILPMLDRWSTTDASRAARERPYQSTRTQFTRRAFAVDQVIDADSSKVPPMTRQEAARGVSNWDQAALMRTAAISRRDLTAIASSWTPGPQGLTALIVQRPTSGSGPTTLTSLNVTSADEQGRPLPALPGQAETDESFPTVLVEPGAPAYAIVADSADDMPAAPFASWFDRLAHAWSLQKPSVLAHDVPELRPRILLHRDVRERIAALAPFLTIGPTLQSAVAADSLYWLAELFVTSDEYPLAQPLLFAGEPRQDGGGSRFSYIRHAATAVVHAHTGRVFIVADRGPDPVMRSWMQRFPWLFVSRDRLPAALGALWPPPVDRAAVQGDAIAHAGFPGDTIIPTRVAASRESAPDAPPLLYAQHGDAGPLSASIAVLESGERMVGVLLARGGREPGVEWHRAASKIPWRGVLDELSASAKRAGMYGTKRGADRRGFVQILPFSDGLGFTQSFYSWGSDAPPALHGVVLLEGGRSHPGATFAEALGISRPVPEGASVAFRSRVAALYETMRAAMRRGDWKVFGDAYATLGRLLHAAP